jgi:hypothetical protein
MKAALIIDYLLLIIYETTIHQSGSSLTIRY